MKRVDGRGVKGTGGEGEEDGGHAAGASQQDPARQTTLYAPPCYTQSLLAAAGSCQNSSTHVSKGVT